VAHEWQYGHGPQSAEPGNAVVPGVTGVERAEWFNVEFDDGRTRWLTTQLSQGDVYLLPRIPGIDRYLGELEAALAQALTGEQSATQALIGAEERWNSISDSLGRGEQRAALNRHLGLAE